MAAMKMFKKRRMKLPRLGATLRLLRKTTQPHIVQRYQREVRLGTQFLQVMRETTLVRLHPHDRSKVQYYPDMRSFQALLEPNRTLPIEKFLAMFSNMVEEKLLKDIHEQLTNYRLVFVNTEQEWFDIYADESGGVESCMTGDVEVKQYVHPENNLALAALYAPGGSSVIARTIVNTAEKWYVRVFGDAMMVNKLNEHGYHRLSDRIRTPFKMWGWSPDGYSRERMVTPYFDFRHNNIETHPETYNRDTGRFEITIS